MTNLILAVILLAIVQVPTLFHTSDNNLSLEEKALFNALNQHRVEQGLKPLELDWRMVNSARQYAREMGSGGFFGHDSPVSGSLRDRLFDAGVNDTTAGENIVGSTTPELAFSALKNSPAHNSNMLKPYYAGTGVGALHGGPYGMLFVQHFRQEPDKTVSTIARAKTAKKRFRVVK